MPTLSSLLVQRGVASMRAVEEAISRQVLQGGDLATTLLEIGAVPEGELTALLAESLGMAAAPGRLRPETPELLRRIPAELASQHGVFPLEHRARGAAGAAQETLVLATSAPLAAAVEDDLGFALGAHLVWVAAPLVRIRQAIADHYGIPLDRRLTRVAAALDARADPAWGHGAPPAAPASPAAPAPPPAAPAAQPARATLRAPSFGPGGAAAPEHPAPMVAIIEDAPTEEKSAAPAQLAHIEDAPTEEGSAAAEERSHIEDAPTQEEPSGSVHDIEAAPTERAPRLLVDEPTGAELPRGPAEGAPGAERRPRPKTQRTGARALTGWLQRAMLEQQPPAPATPAATAPRARRKGPFTVAMAEEELEHLGSTDAVLDVSFRFAQQFFEYAALFVVHGDVAEGRSAAGPGADAARVAKIGVPLDLPSALATARQRRAPLVTALADAGLDAELARDLGRERRAGVDVALIPILVRGRVVALLYGDDGVAPVELASIGEVVSVAGLAATALERLIVRRKLSRVGTAPPGALGARPTPAPAEDPAPPAQRAPEPPAPPALDLAVPFPALELALDGAPRPPAEPAREADAPASDQGPLSARTRAALLALAGSKAALAEGPRRRAPEAPPPEAPPPPLDTLARAFGLRGTGVELEPDAAATVSGWMSSTPDEDAPPAAAAPGDAPSIVPDLVLAVGDEPGSAAPAGSHPAPTGHSARAEHAVLLQQVLDGGEGRERAFAELVRQGDLALQVIVARFPGPLWVDRQRAREFAASPETHDTPSSPGRPSRNLPPASYCGPILELVVAIQRPAIPFMTVRSASPDPEVRFWAAHVLGELRYPETANALLPRLFDDDPAVRGIARRSAAAVIAAPPAGAPILQALAHIARDAEDSTARRVLAIETAAAMRSGALVPSLVAALADPHDAVADAAARALADITREGFGRDAARWSAWWASEGRRRFGEAEKM